jgi:homoserine dehydrogenase
MRDKGLSFADGVKEAPSVLGYAEADPTFRCRRCSTPHTKSTLLAAHGLSVFPVQFDKRTYRRHQPSLKQTILRYAEQLGYRIKLLGIDQAPSPQWRGVARASDADPGQATALPTSKASMNAVLVQG